MKQQTLMGFPNYSKPTRRARFLADMERIMPWAELETTLQQLYLKQGREGGSAPIPLPRMLRAYLLQRWFNLSDSALEEALHDSATMREFAGVDVDAAAVPDESTISWFRELLARHGIGEQVLATVHRQLRRNGVRIINERTADPRLVQAVRPAERVPDRPAEAQPPAAAPKSLNSIGSSEPAAIELALAAMGVGVFEYDAIAGRHRFSDRCKAIWGIPVDEEPTASRVFALVHPHDRDLTAAFDAALLPDGPGHYSIEHRVVLPDGAIRWVQVCGQTVFEGTGPERRAVRSYGTMIDITERRLIERKLYERESQLATFIEGVPAGIAMFDREMRFLAVSSQYAADRGVVASELIGRCAYDVFPKLPERWRAVHRRCLAGASESCDVDVIVRKDGSRDLLRWDFRPWYKADQSVGGLILFSELITKRMHAERRLRDSEARLELAIRAGALGIYDYNIADGTTTWDPRVRALWGADPDEKITLETFLAGLHPDDRAPTMALLEESLGPDSNGTHLAEYRVVNRKDGSTRWISSSGTVFFEGSRAVRMCGIVQDITDRKRAELALAQSAEELREADQRKDAFLATLSHELRNPLAPIRTAAQILARPQLTDEQLNWARQVIQRQTTNMASLLDDLLEVARITQGKLELKKDRVSLTSVVDSALEAARPLLDEKQHRLTVSLPDDALLLDVDPLRLSQVLSNLLGNAAKYTDPNGQIELTARVDGETLELLVKDNGIGIPPEALGQIFTMFWQLEGGTGRSQGGLGIGLAFVKGLVELHGGTIEARSEGPGRGSEFAVRLPVGAAPVVRSAPAGEAQEPAARSCRVLVADDNEDAAESLAMLLRLGRHEVRVAHSGRGALSVAQAFRPDVALLDIGMPELDGYSVARALRREPWGAGICLVALTGWGQEEDKQRAREAGFDHHLTKPVDPERVERLLSTRNPH